MPKYIPTRHVSKLFPYLFFKELNESLTEFTSENPAFLFKGSEFEDRLKETIKNEADGDEEQYFQDLRKELMVKEFEENNLYVLDQGSFLILDTLIKTEDRKTWISEQYKKAKERTTNKYILLAQYYDQNGRPLLTKDLPLKTLRILSDAVDEQGGFIPEDPNLTLCLLEIAPDTQKTNTEESANSTLLILKASEPFMQQLKDLEENPAGPLHEETEMRDNDANVDTE